jgi:hypothetical protein
MAQPVTAFEIGVHKFKSNLVYSRAPQNDLSANVTHSDLNVDIGVGPDA